MNKSKLLSKKASDLLNHILDHPFIIELSLGILPQYKFDFFSTQDKLYLREYSKGLRKLGVLTKYKQFFDESANGIENEQKMLTETQKTHLQSSVMTPSNLLYTSYLMRFIAEGDIPKSIAAFYSCFWVYYKVGIELNKSLKKDNPYYSWIELYASLDFKKATKQMKLILLEVK